MKKWLLLLVLALSCQSSPKSTFSAPDEPYLVVLGNVQDAGSPQIGCKKACCSKLLEKPDPKRMVSSLGLVDPRMGQTWLFDATPDFDTQVNWLQKMSGSERALPNGIFLTHAHIGHYTGLMYLGRESLNAQQVPVFAMPRMRRFLENNGPWNQLVKLKNIELIKLGNDSSIALHQDLRVIPLLVPHRDEYSETVGYRIDGPERSALFIPDIDKWEQWPIDIVDLISKVDYAFLDATFYDEDEVDRDMSEIPHPFVVESMDLFRNLPPSEKEKIHFIHLNHSNPLLLPESKASDQVIANGFRIARFGNKFSL